MRFIFIYIADSEAKVEFMKSVVDDASSSSVLESFLNNLPKTALITSRGLGRSLATKLC